MAVISQFSTAEVIKPDSLKVKLLLKCPAHLQLMTDERTLENNLKDKHLHRPQLLLAGFTDLFTHDRIQLIGNTEMHYLESLPKEKRYESLQKLFEFKVPCIIITEGHALTSEELAEANKQNVAIFSTDLPTVEIFSIMEQFLSDQLAEQISVHGSFVDIFGVGILFVGKSGIGKSEISLDLVERGHRLVADDIVVLTNKTHGIIMGTGTDIVGHFMEIRGLGIIDVSRMFGLKAVRFQKRLEIIVELEIWDKESNYTRTGLDNQPIKVFNANIHHVTLPIIPGKNITVISEVIALNYLLNTYGYNAAEAFQTKLQDKIAQNKNYAQSDIRMVNYFLDDE